MASKWLSKLTHIANNHLVLCRRHHFRKLFDILRVKLRFFYGRKHSFFPIHLIGTFAKRPLAWESGTIRYEFLPCQRYFMPKKDYKMNERTWSSVKKRKIVE